MKRFNRTVWGWVLYDWANSAFATTIMAAILPTFYSTVAAAQLPPHVASSYWGFTNTIAMLIIALTAPILGAISDYLNAKKRFLAAFVAVGVVGTAFLATIHSGEWLKASLLYIVGRTGFASANIFYDALLPHIAPRREIDRVSALGYAVGYLGGGLLLALNLLMILQPHWFGFPDSEAAARFSFLTVAVWWAAFSIPLFRWVPEPLVTQINERKVNPLREGMRRIVGTLREIRRYRQAFRFLLAFWLYNDGIGTIIVMAVIFGVEIGIGQQHLIGAILMVQFVGMPFAILFGKLAQRLGAKRSILLGLSVYTGIAMGGYFIQSAFHFWMLAVAVAMVQGGTQALSRSLYGKLIPREKSAEFYGFYDVSQKFSGILGPAVFGFMSKLTGNSRSGIFSLIVFFIGGALVLLSVEEPETPPKHY